jgi:hypothetical protein
MRIHKLTSKGLIKPSGCCGKLHLRVELIRCLVLSCSVSYIWPAIDSFIFLDGGGCYARRVGNDEFRDVKCFGYIVHYKNSCGRQLGQ